MNAIDSTYDSNGNLVVICDDDARITVDGDTCSPSSRVFHGSITQEDMAEKMGVSRPAYTQMEKSGRQQQKTLERAAAVFGASPSALAGLYGE